MWNLLWRRSNCPIALDVGSASVRLVQLKRTAGGLTAIAGGWWRYPTHIRSVQEAQNPQRRAEVIDAVRTLLRDGDFRGRSAISCLPTSQLSIRNVRLPLSSDAQLHQAVLQEARERFSFEIRPDSLTYLRAGQVRQGSETREEVLMLAAPPQVVEAHLEMLDAMGLRPEHLDAEPIAMFRSFERFLRRSQDEQQVSVIADIGLLGTRVVIARGRQIVFIKWIEIGGYRLNDAVAKQLNLSYEEAADLRVRIIRDHYGCGGGDNESDGAPARKAAEGNSVNWTMRDAIRGEIEALGRELALCLRYCSVTFRGLRPQHITVTGGEAYDPGVVQLLSESVGIPCRVGAPLRGVDTSAIDMGTDRRGTLTEWAICAGLAVRNVDLKPVVQTADGEQRQTA